MKVFTEDNNTLLDNSNPLTFLNAGSCRNLSSSLTPMSKAGLCTVMAPYILIGFPANLWVMWLIAHRTADAFAAEFFLLNVALCDIIFMFAIPINLLCLNDQLEAAWVLDLLKELWVLVWVGRPLFQCCICLERYLAVVRPLTFIRFKPLRFRVALGGLMWVTTIVQLFSVAHMKVGDVVLPLISFAVSLSVMMFYCLSVLWSLKRPGPVETERTGGDQMKRRAFNIILVNLGIVLAGYVPVIVVLPLQPFLSDSLYYDLITDAQFLLIFFGLFQPLFYLHQAGKLTRIFKKWYACI